MKRWFRLGVVFVWLMATACGSPEGDAARDAASPSPTAGTNAREGDAPDLSELVADLGGVGCELSEVDPTEGYDIHRQAGCADGSLQLYTFTSAASQDQVVEGILSIEGEFAVVGDGWVAETKTRAMAGKVKAAIGGTIRS